MATGTAVIALLFAFCLDLWLGKPVSRWHPLARIRGYLGWAGTRIAPHRRTPSPDWLAFSAGALAWSAGAAVCVLLAWLLQWGALLLDPALAGLALGALLKSMLSWRCLRLEVMKVEAALAQSPEAGREQFDRLAGRDVPELDAIDVREATLQWLAENLVASVVAPVFWFFVAGLPGAVFYRFANMAGAVWGHHGFRAGADWEWAGKWAARADDVLTWLPARLTAFLITALSPGWPWREMRREAAHFSSANSGWPAAALALALGTRLRKPGLGVLNGAGAYPEPEHTLRALNLAGRAVAVLLAWICVVLVLAWERPW